MGVATLGLLLKHLVLVLSFPGIERITRRSSSAGITGAADNVAGLMGRNGPLLIRPRKYGSLQLLWRIPPTSPLWPCPFSSPRCSSCGENCAESGLKQGHRPGKPHSSLDPTLVPGTGLRTSRSEVHPNLSNRAQNSPPCPEDPEAIVL